MVHQRAQNPICTPSRVSILSGQYCQPAMFGGQELGELYQLRDDPNETCNLFADPGHREVVAEGRRRLLEWLIGSTRLTTVWPAVDASQAPYDYRTAADGRESNTAGPARRAARHQLNYL